MGAPHEHLSSGLARKHCLSLLHSPISLRPHVGIPLFYAEPSIGWGHYTGSSLGDDRRSFHQRVDDWGVHSSLPNLTLILDPRHDPCPDHGDDRPGVRFDQAWAAGRRSKLGTQIQSTCGTH